MKIINASAGLFMPKPGESILQHLERCGRVCYKSEGLITDGSAEKFVTSIIHRGHEAVLEHGAFIFLLHDVRTFRELHQLIMHLEIKKGFKSYLRFTKDSRTIVSGNIRAWRDFCAAAVYAVGHLPIFMKYFIQGYPTLFPEYQDSAIFGEGMYSGHVFQEIKPSDLKPGIEVDVHYYITAKFICDRGVTHEIVRHRPASFCQESTRYCNYGKNQFGGEITVIRPYFLEENTPAWDFWKDACSVAEGAYFDLLEFGCTPQEARAVLPNSLKTELVMTANVQEWKHFFALRTSQAAHPQMREVATQLEPAFLELIADENFNGIGGAINDHDSI